MRVDLSNIYIIFGVQNVQIAVVDGQSGGVLDMVMGKISFVLKRLGVVKIDAACISLTDIQGRLVRAEHDANGAQRGFHMPDGCIFDDILHDNLVVVSLRDVNPIPQRASGNSSRLIERPHKNLIQK